MCPLAPPLREGPVPSEEEGSVPITDIGEMRKKQDESVENREIDEEEERAKVVAAPIALNRIVPVYPRSARRRGHEGCVTVEISVAEDGNVVGAEVVASSGHDELDQAALQAALAAAAQAQAEQAAQEAEQPAVPEQPLQQ